MIKQSNEKPGYIPVEISIITILVCAFIGFFVIAPYVAISSKNEVNNSRKELVKAGFVRVTLNEYMNSICKSHNGVKKVIKNYGVNSVVCDDGITFPLYLAIKKNKQKVTKHEVQMLTTARWVYQPMSSDEDNYNPDDRSNNITS